MRYAIISVINGNFKIEAECGTNFNQAMTLFHQKCATFWNAQDVEKCCIKVVDENLETVDGKVEYIYHGEEPEGE